MVAKKTSVSYDSIMRDLKSEKYAPIYILMGEEPYYIDKISDFIAENVLRPEERDFNQDVVFGADTNMSRVIDMAKGYPMMASHRVVIVKEAQAMRDLEILEKYLQKPVPTTVLVICYKNGTIDRRKKFMNMADAVGVVYESAKKRDYELPGFIENYLKQKGASIDQKSTQMMVDSIGSDLNRLISEMDKLLITLPKDDRRITPDIIERQIGVSKDFNIFELKRAIVDKNVFKANQIVNYFDKNPKAGPIVLLTSSLFNYFQNLMIAYYVPNRNNENSVMEALGLRSSWMVRDYMTGMRNYSAMKTFLIIQKIRETDAKSKGQGNPSTSDGDLMRELIFFILH